MIKNNENSMRKIIFKQADSEEELLQIADLASKTFSRRSYFDFFEKIRRYQKEDFYFKPEFCFIAKENGKVVSHISITVREVKIGGSVVRLAGISDVCTDKDYRGLGLSKQLMLNAIDYMKKNGFAFSLLYGIPNYYHKFGYIESIPESYFMISRDNILEPEQVDISKYELNIGFDFSLLEDVKRLYQKQYLKCNGIALRPDKNFFYLSLINNHFYYLRDKERGNIVGYFYAWDEYSASFIIKELAVLNESLNSILLSYIKQLAQKYKVYDIKFYIHLDNPYCDFLKDIGAESRSEYRFIGQGGAMTRIIDMKILFEELKNELKNRIINSQFLNKNFTVKINNIDDKKNIFLNYMDGELNILESAKNFDVEINIDNRFFSRVIIGYWNFEKFYKLSGIENDLDIKAIELLNKIFPEFNFYLLKTDYF